MSGIVFDRSTLATTYLAFAASIVGGEDTRGCAELESRRVAHKTSQTVLLAGAKRAGV
jgi:hypothetical protein